MKERAWIISRRSNRVLSDRMIAWARRTGWVLCVLLVLGAGRTVADEPLDGPLPDITPQQLAEKLRESWRSYDKGLLEVAFEVEDNSHDAGGLPVALTDENSKTVLVKYSGRFQYLSDGRRWRSAYDGRQIGADLKLYPDRWSTGFDGERHYSIDDDRERVALGESRRDARQFTTRGLFWPENRSLLIGLADPETKVGQRTEDGVRYYVATRESINDSPEEVVISPRHSYLVIRKTRMMEGKVWESYQVDAVRRNADGVWVPGRIVIESRSYPFRLIPPPPGPFVGLDGQPAAIPKPEPLPPGPLPLLVRRTFTVVRYERDKVFKPEDFAIEVPYGAAVEDRRTGFAYVNDPWWPEVRTMLKEKFADQFEWPIVDMSPLQHLTPSRELVAAIHEGFRSQIEGKGAPALRADLWINSGPLDWEKLRGKVTLVKFWSLDLDNWSLDSDARQHAALRKLYEIYHPARFEIVAIHENTRDPDAVRQFAGELGLPYPIAIDSIVEGSDRTMSWSFEDHNRYQQSFLVDGEGKLHAIPAGRLIETLVDLLKKAGARGVSADSVPYYRLPRSALTHVANTWRSRIKDAKKNGRITGTVTDGRGRPIADVPVRAMLRLKVMTNPFPGTYFVDEYPTPWSTRRGPDGKFAIEGLCKGLYQMEIQVPGKAAVDREAIITPELRSNPVNLVVD